MISLNAALKCLTRQKKPLRRHILAVGRLTDGLRRCIAGWNIAGSNLFEIKFILLFFFLKYYL